MSPSVEFWSSVELGTFARGLLRELTELGWNAEQRFEVTEDEYREAHSPSARLSLRWRSYASYVRRLSRRLGQKPVPSVLVVCTNTFYAPAVALRAALRTGIPVVHWVFDLFPDVLVAGGTIGAESIGQRLLGRLTRSTFEKAAANVFLGERLLSFARQRYGEIPRSTVIPVGADGQPFRSAAPNPRPIEAPLRVLYCGNFGRMHETQTVIDFLRRPLSPGWTLEFRGHGSGFRAVSAALGTTGAREAVVIGDSLRETEWLSAMRAADVALVTMIRGAEGLVMPSKTYSAMMAGQAILAICPVDSDLAETVRHHDAGWVIPPGDVAGLTAAISAAVADPQLVLGKRLNAFRAGHEHYTQKALAVPWNNLLTSLTAARPL